MLSDEIANVIVICFVVFFIVFGIYDFISVRKRPVQQEHAQLLRCMIIKRNLSRLVNLRYTIVTFEFPDRSYKEFYVKRSVFKSLEQQRKQKGVLVYKEKENAKGWEKRLFISFEKDE